MYECNKFGMARQSLTHTPCSGNCGSAEIGVNDGEAFPHTPTYIQSQVVHTSLFGVATRPRGTVMEHVCSSFIFMVHYCHFGVAPVNFSDGKPETPYPL